jgi:addiction module RelB/DinJ family antitoxin
MLQTATIQVKIDPAMKQAVNKLYADMGLTTADAVKLFFKQSLNRNALPFEIIAGNSYFTPAERKELVQSIENVKNGDFIELKPDENVEDFLAKI